MDSTADDAALVTAARDGDAEAFAWLLTRHWSLLLSVCGRMLGDADLAHDMAQEAALQAFLSLDRLQRVERFGPWLSGIGLNVCRHWLRQRGRTDLSWDALLGGCYNPERDVPDDQPGPAEQVAAADLRARVQRAVDDLPRGQRAATVLYYLDGLSYAETAAHLGIAVSAVKTRLHKARGTLRGHLWELWEDQEMTTSAQSPLVEVRIDSVREDTGDTGDPKHVMVLQEVAGPRYLHIWIGAFEATALSNTLANTELPRPMTFAFMANLLRAVQTTMREVQINKLVDETFYATATIEGPGGSHIVDARPSDALNLAALMGAPIRVAPEVLDAVGMTEQKQTI